MPKYLPGRPTMIVRNMPGGGNVLATNYMFTQRRRRQRARRGQQHHPPASGARRPRRALSTPAAFNWLGSTGGSNLFTWVWHTAGFKSMDDVMRRELITGSTASAPALHLIPTP